MKKKEEAFSWKDIKTRLSSKEPEELLKLIEDLYSLNDDNKRFIKARFLQTGDALKSYKEIIEQSLYPDVYEDQPIRLAGGRKAISDYSKATGDPIGTLELMVFYVECGTRFTVEYGDINESFYDSLESMFHKILKKLLKGDQDAVNLFLPRLEAIVDKAQGIGWGYYDSISDALAEAFPE